MADLPEGFQLDEQRPAAPPEGFVLDDGQQPEQEQPGLLSRMGGAVREAVSNPMQTFQSARESVTGAVRGPEGLPDLPEFDAPAPTTGATIKAAGGLMAAVDPEAQKDIILANYPGAEIETVEADGKRYNIVDWTSPEGERFQGYVNAPGLSMRDVTQGAGQFLAFTPAGRAARGAGVLTRMGRTAAAGAGTSAGLDVAAGAAGSEQGISPGRAATEAVIGPAAEILSPAARSLMNRFRGNRSRYFNRRTGELTSEGRRLAEAEGLSAEDIADMGAQARRTFAEYADAGVEPAIGARAARVQEFDIPATRGQVGRAGQQVGAEERMRAGAFGEIPQAQMRQFGEQQQESIGEAATAVQGRLGATGAAREAEAGETIMTGIRAQARNLMTRVDEAYDQVRGQDFAISREAAETLPARIADNLEGTEMSRELTPASIRSMEVVGELTDAVARGDGAKFENFRRRLNSLIGSAANKTDKRAATLVKRTFDEWADDALDNELFTGNPQALQMLKDARALRTQYGKQFEASSKTDSAGKIMQRIVEEAETPEEVVNYVFGQSALGRNRETSKALKRIRDAVGEDSEVWDGVREAAWLRLTRDRRGDLLSGRVLKNNIKELKNRDKTLYDTLFSDEEKRLIDRFSEAIDVTQPPRQNPSGTAASLENAIRYTLRRFGQRESFTKGNVGKGTILNFMARMRLPMVGRIAGGSPAARAQDIRPPAARSAEFVSGAMAGGNIREGQEETEQ